MYKNIDPSSAVCSCKPDSPCFMHFMNPEMNGARRKVKQPPKVDTKKPQRPHPVEPKTVDEDDMETIAEYYKMPSLMPLSPISSPRRRSVDSGVSSDSHELPHADTLKRPRTPGKDIVLPKRFKRDDLPKFSNDYLSDFRKIVSFGQRGEYKKAHLTEYDEYKKLHETVSSRSLIFEALEEKLKRERTGSKKYGKIVKTLFEEYKKSEDLYTKYHYLEAKLKHIKSLIKDYDKTHNIKLEKKLVKLFGED